MVTLNIFEVVPGKKGRPSFSFFFFKKKAADILPPLASYYFSKEEYTVLPPIYPGYAVIVITTSWLSERYYRASLMHALGALYLFVFFPSFVASTPAAGATL